LPPPNKGGPAALPLVVNRSVTDTARVLLVFIDGLGLGRPEPEENPLAGPGGPPLLGPLLAGPEGAPRPGEARRVSFAGRAGHLTAADAVLGVRGLPQSATGQTALLTGANAPALMGRHINAYPTGRLRRLLEERNLLTLGARAGRRVTFLNMFRPDGLELILSGKRRPSATTAAALSAGLKLRTVEDLLAGRAVYHDVTCWTIHGQHYGVPLVAPEEAAGRALAVTRNHDFCLYEYFLTDVAGHSQDRSLCQGVLDILDRFLAALVRGLDPAQDLVVLASDHGNIEDISRRTHTANPVPVLAFGSGTGEVVEGVTAITGVAPRLAARAGIPLPLEGGRPPGPGSEGAAGGSGRGRAGSRPAGPLGRDDE